MDTRCFYCGKETADDQTFCNAGCANAFQMSAAQTLSRMKWFFLGLAVSLVLILWGPISGTDQMVGIGVAVLGFTVAKWPMATADMARAIGYVPSREICRAIGVTIIPVGLATVFFV